MTSTRAWSAVAVAVLIAASCAEPNLGPPSSTTLAVATPTPTPVPESDRVLGSSNTTTTTTIVPIESAPTPAPTPEPIPEVGLTDDIVRIGVIADVTTGTLADDRGLSAWNAMAAWAREINDRGGLAGRTVVIQPIDSAVSFHSEALVEACADVFALVGSWSLNDGDGLEVLLAPGCSLPDFPADARTPRRRLSPVTYQSNPQSNELGQAGGAQFLARQFPDEAQNAAVPILDLEANRVTGERLIEAYTLGGFNITERPTVAVDADLVDLATSLTDLEIQSLVWPGDAARLATLLSEFDRLEFRPGLVDCGAACYDAAWVDEVGELAEGVVVTLPVVPFEEIDTSFELTSYVFWLSRTRPVETPNVVGVQAWAAARLFEEAVRLATFDGTADFDPELLTRAAVLSAVETITEWDANGLHETTNPADGIGSPCLILMTRIGDQWVRTHPFGRGRFDCDADNLVSLERTLGLGLSENVELDFAPDVAPDPGDN